MLNATDTEPTTGKHWPGCVEPGTHRRRNSIGVVWATCRGCGAYWQDPDGWRDIPPTVAENRTPVELVAPPSSGYRCAEHLDEPVTCRGKGCRLCSRKPNQPTEGES
jgi:hypothetical protein